MEIFRLGEGRGQRWIPALIVMVVIFTFSSIPADSMPSFSGFWDLLVKKGAHILVYALLAITLYLALIRSVRRPYLAAFGIAVLYACSDEFHQRFVPGRGSTWIDIGIDALGAIFGLGLLWLVFRPASRIKESDSGG